MWEHKIENGNGDGPDDTEDEDGLEHREPPLVLCYLSCTVARGTGGRYTVSRVMTCSVAVSARIHTVSPLELFFL